MNMLLRQGGFGASCAKSPKWCTPVSKEDKIAQLAQFSLGGRGKKFCGNLPRNLRAELPQMERDKLVAEWCRLVGREDKVAQVGPVSLGGRGKKFRVNLTQNLKAVQAGGEGIAGGATCAI